jgi:hypothetical protein
MKDEKFYTSLGFFKLYLAGSIVLMGIGVYQLAFQQISWYSLLIMAFVIFTSLVILRMVQLIYDRIIRHRYDYQQLEALFSLYQHVDIQTVLPAMRNHAGSPDFLNLIADQLKIHQPKLVLEASSGVSSIIVSEYLIKQLPNSNHLALENEKKYADLTQAKIRNPQSKIIHAPLTKYTLDGKDYQWYDLSQLEQQLDIDLLIVDGPSKNLNALARYPVVPILAQRNALPKIIIMDDADRPDEQEIIKMWSTKYDYDVHYFYLEKGAVVLTKR